MTMDAKHYFVFTDKWFNAFCSILKKFTKKVATRELQMHCKLKAFEKVVLNTITVIIC